MIKRRPWCRVLARVCVGAMVAVGVPVLVGSSGSAGTAELHGHIRSGGAPLASFTVTLWVAGGEGGSPTPIGSSSSAFDGAFELTYDPPADPNSVLYLRAVGPSAIPNPGAATLVSVLGAGTPPPAVVVNDRTTVASAFAMTQFTNEGAISGPSPGLQNAAGMVRNLVDLASGDVSTVLESAPNGTETSARNAFNSLANMVASCVGTPAHCASLFSLATPPGGVAPTDTFSAMVDINRNPANNAAGLFAFAPLVPYVPPLAWAPDAWTLALRFVGDGVSMDGPGNMAVDTDGNIWVTNNYEFAPDATTPVCGGKQLLAFSPTGNYLAGSPFTGGGLDGVGWGIDIDPFGDIWVGNYGFAAPVPACPESDQPKHNSVSQFRSDGTAVSPATGFTQGGISWPQGTKSDRAGNIWIANCEANSVTVYPDGDPTRAREITGTGLVKPFSISHNNTGDVFITGVASNNVVMLRPDGTPALPAPITGGGLDRPMGIAADSAGNQWVANSGFVDLPCPTLDGVSTNGGSVILLNANGQVVQPTPFTGGGLTIPWGIALDGNDNVWVANFAGKRLSAFCGSQPTTCPAGKTTGDAISPSTGYGFDGLVRNTGVVVDPSGNVWLANNWKQVPIQNNPGGYEMVAYVGVAAPVHRAPPIPRPTPIPLVPTFTG